LRSENGYQRFASILTDFSIPYQDIRDDLDLRLTQILTELVNEN
jgi:hypothetical protein